MASQRIIEHVTAEQLQHALIPIVRNGFDIDVIDELFDTVAREIAARRPASTLDTATGMLAAATAQARQIIAEATQRSEEIIWAALSVVADNERIIDTSIRHSISALVDSASTILFDQDVADTTDPNDDRRLEAGFPPPTGQIATVAADTRQPTPEPSSGLDQVKVA